MRETMSKLWIALSITLAVSLVWYAIPAFGGWSWACSSPTFLIEDEEGNEVTVVAGITVNSAGDPEDFDQKRVKVVLEVPDGAHAKVLEDEGCKVTVKHGSDAEEAKLKVVVSKNWRDEYSLRQVSVFRDGTEIEPEKQEPYKWVFKFELS